MAVKIKTAANPKMKPRGKAFPKGVSGNPDGALPTELRFESAYKRVLAQALDAKTVEEYEGAINRMDGLAHRAIKILETTDNEAVFFTGLDKIADRTEGKPKQAVEHTGEDGGPLVVKLMQYKEESTELSTDNDD